MTDREQFSTKVEPIMDRVMQDLRSRQAEEVRRFMRSPAYILSGISGPDGGMASQAIALDSLKVTGEWNSKTVEDYVEMVKGELRKEGITVTPQLEEMMIDKMAREQVPQSSIDYILRKAAGNSIFGLPEEARKTPLQREIEERAEEMYNPSKVEKGSLAGSSSSGRTLPSMRSPTRLTRTSASLYRRSLHPVTSRNGSMRIRRCRSLRSVRHPRPSPSRNLLRKGKKLGKKREKRGKIQSIPNGKKRNLP